MYIISTDNADILREGRHSTGIPRTRRYTYEGGMSRLIRGKEKIQVSSDDLGCLQGLQSSPNILAPKHRVGGPERESSFKPSNWNSGHPDADKKSTYD